MRVCAGRYKGRTLVYPRTGLRPTKDITRQAIFNMLGSLPCGARVCDLFAGGGALGIEALSRGAVEAIFVEKSPAVLRFLRMNVRGLAGARVLRGDVLAVMPRLGSGFDIVLADPPYLNGLVQATLDKAVDHGLVRPGGVFVLEHHRQERPVPGAAWELVRQGRYGETWVSLLRRQDVEGKGK